MKPQPIYWLLLLALLISPALTQAQTIRYVSTTGTNTNPATATSWATSTTNLQGVINSLSATGGQVWVAAGTYKPGGNVNTDRAISFAMRNGVAIYGGFTGNESSLNQRPAINPVNGQPSSSTLSGDIGTVGSNADNSLHVISNPAGLTTTAVLNGFVIASGNAGINGFPNNIGGGIFNNGESGQVCSPTITNCVFTNNRAVYKGGAMFNAGNGGSSSPVLTNCVFRANSGPIYGGAVYNDGSGVNGNSSPRFTTCAFLNNSATFGGAIINDGYFNGNNSSVFINCAFLNNTAANRGGAMQNDGSDSGNGSPSLTNCSFLNNTALNQGGAIHSDGTNFGNSNPSLTNCVFWNNGGNKTLTNTGTNASVTASYSLFDVSVTGYSPDPTNFTTSTSPFIATTTGTPADVALNACAPGIDTGLNTATGLAGITTDMLGNTRVVGGTVDMGALEFLTTPNRPLVFTQQPASGSVVCAGSTVSTSVSVTGTGPYTFQWFKDGVVLSPAQSTSVLTLATVQVGQAGNYSVVVTSACNSVTSNAFSLVVKPLATRLYVRANATGANTGLTWADAFTDLQSALISYPCSGSLTEIWVAAGTYKPNAAFDRTASFAMRNGLAIIGGFAGTETALNQRPAINPVSGQPSSSTLSGNIGNPGISSDNSYHVISNPNGLNTTAVLDGFVMTGGNADGSFPNNNGGGIYNNGAGSGQTCRPTLTNCTFVNNIASQLGGAMYNNGIGGNSGPVLTNCAFQSNTANNGGAVYNDGSGSGGVSSPSLTNCVFLNNTALNQGGAIYNNAQSNGISFAVLTNCEFRNNASAYEGGAFYNDGTSSGQSSPRLTNCAFVSNTAVSSSGGVMYNNGGTGTSSPILVNCSLLNNRGSQFGGAMHNVGTSGSCAPTFTNCALFGNGGNNTFRNENASVTVNYSFLDSSVLGYSGSDNFGSNSSPFVPTVTGQPASVALNPCSQAINGGNPASVTVAAGPYSALALPVTDLTGNARIAGGRVDMGAVEFQPGAIQLPTRLYVKANATGANTGLTWADAFTDLQAALNYYCNTNLTEIWVAAGVYKPTSTTARTISFTMVPGVAIYGGFVGNETALNQRPVINPISGNPSSSTLSGDLGIQGNSTDNSYHVIRNPNGLTSSALLDGFVITGGRADGSTFPENVGGGMYNNGAGRNRFCSPTITNCFFFSNQGSINGGAIYNNGRTSGSSSPVLTNCYFQYNSATTSGGALYNDGTTSGNSSPRLTNCAFLINGTASDNGGAMYNDGGGGTSSPVLLNCSFQGNVAAPLGGAMANNGNAGNSNPVLTNCVLFGNNGNNAIANFNATITATYSLFEPSSVTVSGVDISGPGNLTTTIAPFASFTSVALNPCSAAINMGNPASVTVAAGPYSETALPATDLAGNPRIMAGRVDMGAVEYNQTRQHFTTQQAGNWDNVATWVCGRLPLITDSVELAHAVTIPVNYVGTAQTILYVSGGRLVFATGARLRLKQ